MLLAQDLSKSYGKTDVLHKIYLEILPGEILGILGESGSGKSTLLRLLAGVEDPDGGQLFLNQKAFISSNQRLIPGHPQIKLLGQDAPLLPRHRIMDNLRLELRQYSEEYQKNRLEELIILCRLEGLLNCYPHELSGGQKQRCALAKALADEPLVLLLDEPFSHLDTHLKPTIREEIFRIVKETHLACAFVSHDASDTFSLAHRLAIIKNGEIVQTDTPQNLYQKPKNPYVATFLGAANILYSDSLSALGLNLLPKTLICIRPEDISITKNQRNSIKVKVWDQKFMGHYQLIRVSLEKGENLNIFHFGKENFKPGQKINIQIKAHQIHLF